MKDYKVQSIKKEQTKEWLLKRHYAKRMPPLEFCFGLYWDSIISGVITYGTPPSSPVRESFGVNYKIIELNRLVVSDGLNKNALSYFVSMSLKMLPKPLIVVSYADTSKNHQGYIYQATNFIYTGLSAKRTDWTIRGLEHLHGATVADKSRGKENRADYMRERYGDDFYLKDRPRKHRYFYFLGSRTQRRKMLLLLPYNVEPYPKGDNQRYEIKDQAIHQQMGLF